MRSALLLLLVSYPIALGGTPATKPSSSRPDMQRLKRLIATSQASDLLTEDDAQFLAGIATTKTSPLLPRLQAMELLSRKAAATDSKEALGAIKSLAEEMRDESLRDSRRRIETEAVLQSFFEHDAAELVKRAAVTDDVFDVGISTIKDKNLVSVWPHVLKFIASAPAPVETRRRYMLEAIKALPAGERAPEEFRILITPDVLKELRQVAFGTTPKNQPPHMPALDLLVEAGDLQSVPLLKERATALGKAEEYNQPGAGAIWRIEAQHDPQMLLDVLASDAWIDFGGSRMWVLDKAVQLGVDKRRIANAIIAFSKHINKNMWFRGELAGLKREAIRLRVFEGDELPDIKVPTTRPTSGPDGM